MRSYVLFLMRGIGSKTGSTITETRLIGIMPRVIDTLLLSNAIALVVIIHQFPFADVKPMAKPDSRKA
jgi:uncharacterized membrane protein SirB2